MRNTKVINRMLIQLTSKPLLQNGHYKFSNVWEGRQASSKRGLPSQKNDCFAPKPQFLFTIEYYYQNDDVCKNQMSKPSKLAKKCVF